MNLSTMFKFACFDPIYSQLRRRILLRISRKGKRRSLPCTLFRSRNNVTKARRRRKGEKGARWRIKMPSFKFSGYQRLKKISSSSRAPLGAFLSVGGIPGLPIPSLRTSPPERQRPSEGKRQESRKSRNLARGDHRSSSITTRSSRQTASEGGFRSWCSRIFKKFSCAGCGGDAKRVTANGRGDRKGRKSRRWSVRTSNIDSVTDLLDYVIDIQ